MSVPQMSPTEFLARWGEPGGEQVILLDVREDPELAIARLEGALHIPMGQVPDKLNELNPEVPIVVMCHSGMRSQRVAEYLANEGYSSVANLTGGIDAWSREVDTNIPRY